MLQIQDSRKCSFSAVVDNGDFPHLTNVTLSAFFAAARGVFCEGKRIQCIAGHGRGW